MQNNNFSENAANAPLQVFFKTFGCRSNIADTQIMTSKLRDFKLANNEMEADIIIINSCSVTNGADRAIKEYLNKINKLNKKIFFTGCSLEIMGKKAYENSAIWAAFGHSQKENINSLLKNPHRFFLKDDFNHIDSTIPLDFRDKTRAFVKIQEGCDFKCSFCIIPQVRGFARSLDEKNILNQIANLRASEVVLSGTNLGSYGKDTNTNLARLIEKISDFSHIKRIRLGSLEPSQINSEFLAILDNEKLERHLHIALQHTENSMLKLMNRQNCFERDLELFSYIADRGFALGTDFIIAHPGETETIFKHAFNNLTKLPLTHIHAFIYSKRDSTPSALLKNDISKTTAKSRLKQITDLIKQKNLSFKTQLKNKNIALEILCEGAKNGIYSGFDQFYNKMQIKSHQNLARKWLKIEDYLLREDCNYAEI